MVPTSNDLLKLLKSFSEALKYWRTSLATSEVTLAQTARLEKPLEELEKLATLIKAHVTKVGIVFKPENLRLVDAAYKTVEQLSETVVLTVTVVAQLSPVEISDIYHSEILGLVKSLLSTTDTFAEELSLLVEEQESTSTETSDSKIDQRLVSVGRLWEHCDELIDLIKTGKLGLLNRRIKQSILLIDDGLDEFAEWAQDPEGFEMEDPFGLSDSEDETTENPPKADNNEELITFASTWLEKFKLIKLLFSSLLRSLPSVTSGTTINSIYNTQKDIVALIDKLIVDLMLENYIGDECKQYALDITSKCLKLVRAVKSANKGSDTKIKWCDAWEKKFAEKYNDTK